MNTSSLLIEIFTEELPYSAVKKEFGSVLSKFESAVKKYRLDSWDSRESNAKSSVDSPKSISDLSADSHKIAFFYTPRRLIFYARNFPQNQRDEIIESFGPPLNIAYQNNAPTNATKSFLSKLNITLDEVQIKEKNGKECLYFAKKENGKNTRNLLENIIDDFLDSLSFDKKMRWGSVENAFVRPIRNIFVLFGDEFVKTPNLAKKYGFTQSAIISPHRNCAPKEIKSANEYFAFLEKNAVIYSQSARKKRILEQIKNCGLFVEIDADLLNEVVAICEYPNALVGAFDERFLVLPKEVIVTSMKVNQKYFATYKSKDFCALNNAFIVVCNSTNPSPLIAQGNVKVLSARLEDALFFYHNDCKNFNADCCDLRLKNIEFMKGGGSLWDKVKREQKIAEIIAQSLDSREFGAKDSGDLDAVNLAHIKKAIAISKNDLLSEMVGEFGELQGIMGGYYAKNAGLDSAICEAIKEQYLNAPSSVSGAILGIANKLDSILCLFALDKIPSGSKDPFALRRGANGILKMIEKFNLHFDLGAICQKLSATYAKIDIAKIQGFFYERLEGVLGVNQSVINAVIRTGESDLLELIRKIKALNLIAKSPDKGALKVLFKRVANILSDTKATKINENLLTENAEKELYKAICDFKKLSFTSHKKRIIALLDFKIVLEKFFDSVLINAEDLAIKENRILLIKAVYEEFFKVGDIKEISF
ncbi:glycine--tRNA ligase subunit beta [Helicobacter sp. 23-1044]